MSEPIPIGLPSSSKRSRSGLVASSRLINCYRETEGPDAKNSFSLVAINGWEDYATLPGASGGVRAMLALDRELLVVAGRQVYTINKAQEVTLVGGIASDGLVTMARNRQSPDPQAVIVCDGTWYVYQAGVVTQQSNPNLPAPIYVVEEDGYFIFLSESGRFTLSGIDDVTIDALDFATAQENADAGVALATRGTDLIIFGERTIEFWTNTGNADFPFELQAHREFGCYAAGGVAKATAIIEGRMIDTVIWTATDGEGQFTGVYMLTGYEAVKISTYEVDRAIAADANPDAIRAVAWSEDGHVFVAITGTGYTHVYDTVEGAWHERKSIGYANWRVCCHAGFDRKTLFGNTISDEHGAYIHRSHIDLYEADDESIQMEMQLPITHAWPYNLVLDRVVVDAVTGTGLNSTDEDLADPEVVFDLSVDGGKNFGTERHRTIGRQGQTLTNIDFWGCGQIPRTGAVLRFRLSPGVKRVVMGVAVAIERLTA